MKEIKDYLHLYTGCEVQVTTNEYGLHGSPGSFKGVMRGLTIDIWKQQEQSPAVQVYVNETTYYFYKIAQVKMVLRKLSNMTDNEIDEVWNMEETNNVLAMEYSDGTRIRKVSLTADRTIYLLSKGFDLFGLIESGLAIDKDTLKD